MKKLTGKLSFNARVNLSNSNLSNRTNEPRPISKSVGVYYLFSAVQFPLSVGGLDDFSDKDNTHFARGLFYYIQIFTKEPISADLNAASITFRSTRMCSAVTKGVASPRTDATKLR